MTRPTRKPNRLKGYDHSQPGGYFITICSQNRQWMFWEVGASIARPGEAQPLSFIGKIIENAILEIPGHYSAITVDNYVVMPNHIHLLITSCPEDGRAMHAPTPDISRVIQQFKGVVTKRAGCPVWQKTFHDSIVRDENSYWKMYEYIDNNPYKWEEDSLNIWK